MALTDINFQEGEGQDMLLQIPVGTLYAPEDILVETDSGMYPILETVLVSSGGNIFILND